MWLLNDGSFAVRTQAPRPDRGTFQACRWCGSATENKSRKCGECLRDIETDRRIDERRGR